MPSVCHEPADKRGDYRVRFTAGARAGAARGPQLSPPERGSHSRAAQADGARRARRKVRALQDDPSFRWDVPESTMAGVRGQLATHTALSVLAAMTCGAPAVCGQMAAGDSGARPVILTFSYTGELVQNAGGGARPGGRAQRRGWAVNLSQHRRRYARRLQALAQRRVARGRPRRRAGGPPGGRDSAVRVGRRRPARRRGGAARTSEHRGRAATTALRDRPWTRASLRGEARTRRVVLHGAILGSRGHATERRVAATSRQRR